MTSRLVSGIEAALPSRMRLLLPLLVAVLALLLAAGFPRVRWAAAGLVVAVLLYVVLKMAGVIESIQPQRSGVF